MERLPDNYFLKMIHTLRRQEEVVLYGNILEIAPDEAAMVIDFLKREYDQEALNHPYRAPDYDPHASLWAAKIVYVSAQLILYRENKETDLLALLPDFPYEANASAILSADLCLRFLPDMLVQLALIDREDALIQVLEDKLKQWHYSGVHYSLDIETLDFTGITPDACLHHLYCNRILQHKKIVFATHSLFKESIRAHVGLYGQDFWNEFITATTTNEYH